jgi:hypothetical protein
MQPGGLQTTDERRLIAGAMDLSPKEEKANLSLGGAALLNHTVIEAAKRGIKVLYLLPWSYCPPELAEPRRKANKILLAEILERVPVLWEPSMGVHDKTEDFSDSVQHLTAEAARTRSRFLAETLISSKEFGHKPEPRFESPSIPTSGKTTPNTPP